MQTLFLHMTPTLWQCVVFGILGICGEVLFTAGETLARTRSPRLMGFSFVWMFPIYGLIPLLFPHLQSLIAALPWGLRGVIYMLAIYTVEYTTGALLKRLIGQHAWHYTSRYNLHGHIQLFPHAPTWFVVGLLVERYFDRVSALSGWLAQHM